MKYLINFDLFESRGNPIETRYTLLQLEKYADDPDVFISYRHMEKIGINPKTRYNTPNGIYAYHLQTVLNKNTSVNNLNVPFAGENPWIYVFKPKNASKVLYLDKYSWSQLKLDRMKLAMILLKQFKKDSAYNRLDKENKRELFKKILRIIKISSEDRSYSGEFGVSVWNMTRVAAIVIDKFKKSSLNNFLNGFTDKQIKEISKRRANHPVNLWSKIFIVLGYTGIVDPGYGIIHRAEPSQAVFFNRALIKVIDKIKNVDLSSSIDILNTETSKDFKIRYLCNKYKIKNYTINKDYSIDVSGGVYLYNKDLKKLPLKFNKVTGKFNCFGNKLTSLEGAPQIVGGDFICFDNKLTNLEGAPEEIDGNFECNINRLTSLEGAPKIVGGDFNCAVNKLTNLEGQRAEVVGKFDCSLNKLTSLEGAPEIIRADFRCNSNKLTSLEGAPKEVGEGFICHNNTKQFTEKDVRAVINVKGIVKV